MKYREKPRLNETASGEAIGSRQRRVSVSTSSHSPQVCGVTLTCLLTANEYGPPFSSLSRSSANTSFSSIGSGTVGSMNSSEETACVKAVGWADKVTHVCRIIKTAYRWIVMLFIFSSDI